MADRDYLRDLNIYTDLHLIDECLVWAFDLGLLRVKKMQYK